MDQKFLDALENIQTNNSTVTSVLALFTRINNMEATDVIATYQTFVFYISATTLSDIKDYETKRRLEQMKSAIITRMKGLVVNAPRSERRAVALVFASSMNSLGSMVYFEKILAS